MPSISRIQVKTKSGLYGWQNRLQSEYDHFSDFESLDKAYGLVARLGFASAREAWDANPLVQGSTAPEDYCVVHEGPTHIRVVVELQIDHDEVDGQIPDWIAKEACTDAVENALHNAIANGCSHGHADTLSIGLVAVEAE